ncbi:MAG: OmpA family protein [Betaproteobacteria bacterium]|nr:OmpA family protein [Betaproteobacteria bacterium]
MKTSSKLLASSLFLLGMPWVMAPAHAQDLSGYLRDSSGHVVTDAYGDCWKTGHWTPALATPECSPEAVRAPAPPTPTAPPAPSAAPVVTFRTETLFDFNRAHLRPTGRQALRHLAGQVRAQDPNATLVVSGYTDRIGGDAYNLRLSARRAASAKDYLVSRGIGANRIETRAMGKADPIVSCGDVPGPVNHTNAALIRCLQPNRRVVVRIRAPQAGGASAQGQ